LHCSVRHELDATKEVRAGVSDQGGKRQAARQAFRTMICTIQKAQDVTAKHHKSVGLKFQMRLL
jgi:ribosomal protein S11